MMWDKITTRDELLGLFQARTPVTASISDGFSSRRSLNLETGKVIAIWRDDPSEEYFPPFALIVNVGGTSDFLAWALTYIPQLRPFSAFCRVLEPQSAWLLSDESRPNTFPMFAAPSLGLILCEALTHAVNVKGSGIKVDTLSPLACSTTFSYAMTQALKLNDPEVHLSAMGDAWTLARSLTHQFKLDLDVQHLTLPWHILSRIAGVFSDGGSRHIPISTDWIEAACHEIKADGRADTSRILTHIRGSHNFEGLEENMDASRETRVRYFEDVMDRLSTDTNLPPANGAFFCGYLASLISPGTLDHIEVVIPHLRHFPAALLWYGLCAGLNPKPKIDRFSNNLGRHLQRELGRDLRILESPTCDISLQEIEVLHQGKNSSWQFRTATQGIAEVELFPFVTTNVKWPTQSRPNIEPEELPLQEITTGMDMERIRTLISALTLTSSDLSKIIGEIKQPTKTPRKKRSRKKN